MYRNKMAEEDLPVRVVTERAEVVEDRAHGILGRRSEAQSKVEEGSSAEFNEMSRKAFIEDNHKSRLDKSQKKTRFRIIDKGPGCSKCLTHIRYGLNSMTEWAKANIDELEQWQKVGIV